MTEVADFEASELAAMVNVLQALAATYPPESPEYTILKAAQSIGAERALALYEMRIAEHRA